MNERQPIQDAVQQYLTERRCLGFDLKIAGRQLMRFACFADARHHVGPLTQDLQVDWARQQGQRVSDITAARRLELLRPFATYYRQFEPMTAVLPTHYLGRAHRRLAPHIYMQVEIIDLLAATDSMSTITSLRPITYRTLFGLIAATGLRLSEALNLDCGDVDIIGFRLIVRQTKFNKSRCLPIQPSVAKALDFYRRERRRHFYDSPNTPFIVSETGSRLTIDNVHYAFGRLRRYLGWTARGDHAKPRIHDLRHTFAVNYVTNWHRQGMPIDQGMLWLCTYLGHAKISDTYWYLSATPELMTLIADRFEKFATSTGDANA